MIIKGLECFLCDACGEIRHRKDVNVMGAGHEFCSVRCAERGKQGDFAANCCWTCAKSVDGPIQHYWWHIVAGNYLPIFCSSDCRQEYSESRKQWDTSPDATGLGWISVDERLPEENKRVLLFVVDATPPFVAIGWGQPASIAEVFWRWVLPIGTWYDKKDVTHWQPLPAPPVAKEEPIVGRCQDCRFWTTNEGSGGWGVCRLASPPWQSGLVLMFAEVQTRQGPAIAVDVNTSAKFGCTEFQPTGEV